MRGVLIGGIWQKIICLCCVELCQRATGPTEIEIDIGARVNRLRGSRLVACRK